MEYTIRWRNQGSIIESGMTKWVLALYNSTGTLVKSHEDSTPSNVSDFSDVVIKMPLTYDEAITQTASNTLKIYFDRISTSTLLGEKVILFDITKLSIDIANAPKTELPGINFAWTGVKAKVSTNGKCGASNGNTICPGSQCCSSSGWCAGGIGFSSAWCSVRKNINSTYYTYIGGNSEYDGVDVKNMKVNIDGIPHINPSISTDGKCGPANKKRCPNRECCGYNGVCGGYKPNYSPSCSNYDRMSMTSRGFVVYFKGGYSDYDGDGQVAITYPPQVKNLTDVLNTELVLKCDKNDPLGNNNSSIYKWDDSTDSMKNISTVPAGYGTYNLKNCAGVEYGGTA